MWLYARVHIKVHALARMYTCTHTLKQAASMIQHPWSTSVKAVNTDAPAALFSPLAHTILGPAYLFRF